VSSGRAVDYADLESWLRLCFGLDLPQGERAKKLPLRTHEDAAVPASPTKPPGGPEE